MRYDLAVRSPEYVRELAQHHTGGYLKIAPEHTEDGPLEQMMKPGIGAYDRFKELFDRYSKEAGKEQYLIPYFIAAHPGTTDEDMLNLALWLKRNGFRPDQVQAFLPSPMASATAMYHTGYNPLRSLTAKAARVDASKASRSAGCTRRSCAITTPNNWPMLREALARMGRSDLIGGGPRTVVPVRQPLGWVAKPAHAAAVSVKRKRHPKARNRAHTTYRSASAPRAVILKESETRSLKS